MLHDNSKTKLDFDLLNQIYVHLADDISKEIFQARFMYAITGDSKYLTDLILNITDEPSIEKMKKNVEFVLFGGGYYGKLILNSMRLCNWKYIIDNNPKKETIDGILMISIKKFFEKYNGEYIVISSPLYYQSMEKQLDEFHVPKEKIINLGELIPRLPQKQYFDLEFLEPARGKEVFIDVGCYDGMTSKCFCEWCKDKKEAKIYAFEADKSNVPQCRERLEQMHVDYTLVEKGLWSKNTILSFRAEGNVASRVDDEGEEKIEVLSLDQYLRDEAATFIKMDIEGAELEALKGAEQQIRKNKPKLAISVYHKANDIWQIPNLILEYNPNYKLYLRHYTIGEWDTILYAI